MRSGRGLRLHQYRDLLVPILQRFKPGIDVAEETSRTPLIHVDASADPACLDSLVTLTASTACGTQPTEP